MRKRMVSIIGILLPMLFIQQAQACLRTELDERAVQWASVIVKANLVSVKTNDREKGDPLDVVTSTWKVTAVFDGPTKVDSEITVLTFVSPNADASVDPCSVLPQPGKSMVLLLRLAKDSEFETHKDLKTAAGDPYVIVYRLTEDDATEEAVKDLQQKVKDVRKAEASFNEKDAKFQAETLANAVDDIEADHADSALLEMGPKSIPAMKEVLEKSPGTGKKRLQRIIEELSPPPADTGKRKD